MPAKDATLLSPTVVTAAAAVVEAAGDEAEVAAVETAVREIGHAVRAAIRISRGGTNVKDAKLGSQTA